MDNKNKRLAGHRKWGTGIALLLLLSAAGAARLHGQSGSTVTTTEKRAMTTGSRFYCNIKALNPAERSRHKVLTDKLIAARKEIVETAKGYEFQYSPANVSLAELAEWVDAEGKCCPFFDFHIDLEREGTVLCLRLSGGEGIKPFIKSEFGIPNK